MSDDQHNPFAPPAGADASFQPAPEQEEMGDLEQELAQTRPTFLVKAAIATMAGSGALLLLSALQLWGGVLLRDWLRAVPGAMAGVGVVSIFLALKIYRQRVWAATGGLIVALLTAVGAGTWFIVSIMSGVLSPLGLLTPITAAVAAVFTGLAIGPCRRTARTRRRLAAHGLDVDF